MKNEITIYLSAPAIITLPSGKVKVYTSAETSEAVCAAMSLCVFNPEGESEAAQWDVLFPFEEEEDEKAAEAFILTADGALRSTSEAFPAWEEVVRADVPTTPEYWAERRPAPMPVVYGSEDMTAGADNLEVILSSATLDEIKKGYVLLKRLEESDYLHMVKSLFGPLVSYMVLADGKAVKSAPNEDLVEVPLSEVPPFDRVAAEASLAEVRRQALAR